MNEWSQETNCVEGCRHLHLAHRPSEVHSWGAARGKEGCHNELPWTPPQWDYRASSWVAWASHPPPRTSLSLSLFALLLFFLPTTKRWKEKPKGGEKKKDKKTYALAGNWTRVARVAGGHHTTRPQVPCHEIFVLRHWNDSEASDRLALLWNRLQQGWSDKTYVEWL